MGLPSNSVKWRHTPVSVERGVHGTRADVTYAKAFFDLQLAFAERVSQLSGVSLARTLLDYTTFYIRFGLGREFDSEHPVWREYVAGLQSALDRGDWTFRFYQMRAQQPVLPPHLVATFGCFSYSRLSDDQLRLHFQNAESNGDAPLAAARREQRVADLTAMFAHIQQTGDHGLRMIGASWLYNLAAYRRLFPAAYLETARAIKGRFRHMPLWGQFLNRHGETKDTVAREFLDRLRLHSTIENLDQCFAFHVLRLEAPVRSFYDFYGLDTG